MREGGPETRGTATSGEQLADELGKALDELHATLTPLTAEEWRSLCPAEGWTVGLVAYHIGRGLERQAGWIAEQLDHGGVHEFSWDATNALNAEIARDHELPPKDEVRRLLSERGDGLLALARSMSDEQLDAPVLLAGGKQRSAKFVIAAVALRHIREHHASIRAALAGQGSEPA